MAKRYSLKLKRFYLKPIKNAIYGMWGTVYPKSEQVNWEELIKGCGGKKLMWTDLFFWNKQKKVLTFYANWEIVASITCKIYRMDVTVVSVWDEAYKLMKEQQKNKIKKLQEDIIEAEVVLPNGFELEGYSG